jgi:hypothetical protein
VDGSARSIEEELAAVRRQLKQLSHYRLASGLAEKERLEYESLCRRERELLDQQSTEAGQ